MKLELDHSLAIFPQHEFRLETQSNVTGFVTACLLRELNNKYKSYNVFLECLHFLY